MAKLLEEVEHHLHLDDAASSRTMSDMPAPVMSLPVAPGDSSARRSSLGSIPRATGARMSRQSLASLARPVNFMGNLLELLALKEAKGVTPDCIVGSLTRAQTRWEKVLVSLGCGSGGGLLAENMDWVRGCRGGDVFL